MELPEILVNPDKNETVEHNGKRYLCYAIKTKVVDNSDKLSDIIDNYAAPVVQPGDILFVSEKMIACTQNRAIPLEDIHPGRLARLLCRFVTKTKHGIGLGMPETMQCALKECGVFRILLASFIGAVGKLFRKKGWFYIVAGPKAAGIDGPCHYTLPPYNKYVVLTPEKPALVAAEISARIGGNTALVVDLNDLGGAILGASDSKEMPEHYLALLKQNPLGQSSECTPMGILRPVIEEAEAV